MKNNHHSTSWATILNNAQLVLKFKTQHDRASSNSIKATVQNVKDVLIHTNTSFELLKAEIDYINQPVPSAVGMPDFPSNIFVMGIIDPSRIRKNDRPDLTGNVVSNYWKLMETVYVLT